MDKIKKFTKITAFHWQEDGHHANHLSKIVGLQTKSQKFIDKPKPFYISNIIKLSLNGKLSDSLKIVKELFEKGYSPNDILLTFMKFLLNEDYDISEETKLKIYELVSLNYIRVNDGIDTLLQLCGCVSNIFLYIGNDSK